MTRPSVSMSVTTDPSGSISASNVLTSSCGFTWHRTRADDRARLIGDRDTPP